MVSATILAIFFVPVFFVVVLSVFRVRPRPTKAPMPEPGAVAVRQES
jgi:heme/copper-type cytochrome/quinol oxidase subunit 2